uniref:Neural cell adhesion molecule 1-like n=1 Tax=Crassostrea virginica TaxID=6565 RepID=A0A8B8AJ37_CRAVI|nr:neural cell adhesion molecule 1-like [Crassostrea virginica]
MCIVTDANPNTGITWRWIRADSPNVIFHTGPNFTISNIQREISGSFNCTASNSVGTSEAAVLIVDVQYKPEVRCSLPSPYRVKEGESAALICTLTAANPNTSISWAWIKTDSPNTALHTGPNYIIHNIQRGRSGSYNCTATNTVGTSEPITIKIDVLFGPYIQVQAVTIVNESERAVLTGNISSNPLSNVSLYDGPRLLEFENTRNITFIIKEKARCTDTKNFTLTASNAVLVNVTSSIQLIVNCKPTSDVSNITLKVSDDTGFAFSTTVISYPKPHYALLYENYMKTHDILDNMRVNAINNFNIHFNKTIVKQTDYGIYRLFINNTFGGTVIYITVIPQRKPDRPRDVEMICNVKSAKIQWMSSLNGGDSQTFTVNAFLARQEASRSVPVHDKGENILHNTQLYNLQPSTKYTFYVVAQNKHGDTSSEKIECTTLEDPGNQAPLVAGSTVGTLGLLILIFVAVFFFHRRYTCIIGVERRKGRKKSNNEEPSLYTTMTEHENTERNVYDELTLDQSQYESVLMKDLKGNDIKLYEKLQKPQNDNKMHLNEQMHEQPSEGSFKPSNGPSTQETTCEYTNTSFQK